MAAPILKNRAGVLCTTTGTVTVTLGAAIGSGTAVNQCSWQTFASAGVADGNVVRYLILDANGAWEYGTGTYTASGTTLSRTLGASSTGSLLSLSGSSQVFIAADAEDIVPYDSVTGTVTATLGVLTGSTASTTPSTGTLIVTGGAGIGGNANISGLTTIGGFAQAIIGGASSELQIVGPGANTAISIASIGATAGGGGSAAAKTRGSTPTTHSAVTSGDELGGWSALASDGTAYVPSAYYSFHVDGAVSAGVVPIGFYISTGNSGFGTYRINIASTGEVGIGVGSATAARRLQVAQDDATTNAVTYLQRVTHTTTGTPAIGIGVGMEFEVECASANRVGATIEAAVQTVTNAAENFSLNAKQMCAGALQEAEGLTFLLRSHTAGVAYTNSTAVQPWFPTGTTGSLAVEGSTSYEFEGILYVATTGATTAHTISTLFGGTATLTSIGYVANAFHAVINTTASAATASIANFTSVNQATATVVTATSGTTTALVTTIWVRGIVRVNAAGTFIPQWSMSAARGAGTVLTNTFFKLRKFGSNTNTTQGNWA